MTEYLKLAALAIRDKDFLLPEHFEQLVSVSRKNFIKFSIKTATTISITLVTLERPTASKFVPLPKFMVGIAPAG